jgi:hypothetical protein
VTTMKRRGVLKIILILAGTLILTQCRPRLLSRPLLKRHREWVRMPISRLSRSWWRALG